MTQNGLTIGIKIQSISDIITNSSTSVITIYNKGDLNTIKRIVNAILAIDIAYTFDELFTIELSIGSDSLYDLYDHCNDISDKFESFEAFDDYVHNKASEEELDELNDRYYNMSYYDNYQSIYDGYIVKPREDRKSSDILEKAARAINRMDVIFEHDACFTG